MATPEELLDTALEAADAAAAVHARLHGRIGASDASEKGAADFVSEADFEAQRVALDVILGRFPDHRVLSEEDDPDDNTRLGGASSEAPLWVIDPLDGTTNFIHGHPMYASSIGVVVDGEPVAGAVVSAPTGERWWAHRGGGAFRNGEPIQVSGTRDLRLALMGTGFPFKKMDALPRFLAELECVLPVCSGIRRGGSAALDLCYLAQGSLDVFWEITLDPWDIAAGVVIVSEAGGVLSRTDGSPLVVEEPGSVLGANSPELRTLAQGLLATAGTSHE